MSFLPGWDSIESTEAIAHGLHITAIVVLGLLVVSEAAALIYDSRNHHLAGTAESERIALEQKKYNDAESRHATEIGGVKRALTDAEKKVAELERMRAPRHLTDEQKAKLTKFITGNSTGSANFTIKASASENDARAYADEIAAFFNAAPINWQVKVDNAIVMGPDTSGVWITIKDANAVPAATGLLHAALVDAGFPIRKDVAVDPGVTNPSDIWLTVGAKR